jgi:predicted nucleic-acid-binding protein
MRAVDTNAVVRLLVRDDAKQARAAEEFTASGAWVSHLVLAETVWVLDARYERSARQIATAVEMLLNHKDLTLQDADLVLCALEQFKKRPKVGFSDWLVLEIARKAGHLPLGTFDRDLSRCDGTQRLK